jgi:hypothetical protein
MPDKCTDPIWLLGGAGPMQSMAGTFHSFSCFNLQILSILSLFYYLYYCNMLLCKYTWQSLEKGLKQWFLDIFMPTTLRFVHLMLPSCFPYLLIAIPSAYSSIHIPPVTGVHTKFTISPSCAIIASCHFATAADSASLHDLETVPHVSPHTPLQFM